MATTLHKQKNFSGIWNSRQRGISVHVYVCVWQKKKFLKHSCIGTFFFSLQTLKLQRELHCRTRLVSLEKGIVLLTQQLQSQAAPRDGRITVFSATVLLECHNLASTMCECFSVMHQLLYITHTHVQCAKPCADIECSNMCLQIII